MNNYINRKTITTLWRIYKMESYWKTIKYTIYYKYYISIIYSFALYAKQFSVQTDVTRVLQGKLEGCTVNSQGVILNHTTYYLNPDAHIFI